MQKSMVHELNPLVTSNVQYTRSSFIHTVYENDFNELRKSRIQNLPNYRKQDLSGKLNFVVVFQSIEIQRLSVQIETLRVKLKDYERQLCNYENYEVQIRELTEKCHSYELQREDHQQHMQKMGKICQQLYNQLEEMRARYADIDLSLKEKYRLQKQRSQMLVSEIQKWKARYNASETSKAKQLEDMRMMLENQRKSMLQRQMREMSLKYEGERSMLETELRKSRENLQNRTYQVQRMRQELEESRVREGELRQYEQRLDEYEDKLMMMAQQNMRLNELLRMKKQQIEQLKNKERNLQIKLDNLSKIEQEFSVVAKRLQNQQSELREWNQKYTRLEAENNRNVILSNKAQQYQRLLDSSAEEMEKMNTIIRQKISEIERHKSFNQRLQMELEQSKLSQDQMQEYEAHIVEISNQNQRLNDQLRNRLQEVQTWKAKFAEIETKLPLLTQSQNECKNLKQKLSVEVSTRTKLSETISMLEKDLSKAAQMEEALIKERGTNKDLQRQIQRLNGSIRNLSAQNGDSVKKIQTLELQLKQNTGILDELQQCKRKINMMTQQLDRINGLIHEKLQQIKQLKENYNSVSINTTRYRQIEEQFVANLEQTEKLVLKLDESRRENQCVNQKLLNCEARCKKLQSEIFTNNEEKQKLISIVNQKKVELEDLVSRMQKADQKISSLQSIEQQYKTLKTNFSQLQQRHKDIESRCQKQSKRSEEFSNQVESLTVELMKLKNESNFSKQFVGEFMSLKTISEQKDRMIAILMQKVAVVEKCIMMLKQQAKKNYNGMCVHIDKWKVLNSNFEYFSGFMDKFFEMQAKIQQLSEENMKLQCSINMNNIQMAESQYASQNSYKKIEEHRISVSAPKIESRTIIEKPSSVNYQQKSSSSTTTRTGERPSSPIHYTQSQYIEVSSHQPTSAQALSPGAKLSTIDEDCTLQVSSRTIEPYSSSINNNQNYYQSQVRELYGNGSNVYQPPIYSSNVQSSYYQQQQRPSLDGNNTSVQYTTKALRPGSSQESTTTYSYSSNYGNNNYGGNQGGYRVLSPTMEQVQNSSSIYGSSTNYGNTGGNQPLGSGRQTHTNHHFSNLTNIERPSSNFTKPSSKYSVSEVKASSPDARDQGSYQNGDARRSVLSPVRFFG